ncbi:MAG: alpha-amylase [Nitrospirota bacterium]|nr:alpha-amylase [Nitrospirota bacterium]
MKLPMPAPPLIYNLFPLLAGPFPDWIPHLERAREMGFNHLYFNPVSYPGFSGSLYSVKNHYGFHPMLAPEGDKAAGRALAELLKRMRGTGLTPMMDLVINHTAIDCPLIEHHPNWYAHDANGRVERPGALHDGHWVEWGDLATVNNAASPDRDALWDYWDRLVAHHQNLGVQAFRCDAAYQVPVDLWRHLIGRARERDPRVAFFAETLGCPVEDVIALAGAGFGYTFNSSGWWDYQEPWCLKQYAETRPHAATVAFAESHDTERLATRVHGDTGLLLARQAFASLFSTGMLMPMGLEFGSRTPMNVVRSRPEDLDRPLDLSGAIGELIRLKTAHPVFCGEGPMHAVDASHSHVTALQKDAQTGSMAALIQVSRDGQRGVPEGAPPGWQDAAEVTPDCLLLHGAPLRVWVRGQAG